MLVLALVSARDVLGIRTTVNVVVRTAMASSSLAAMTALELRGRLLRRSNTRGRLVDYRKPKIERRCMLLESSPFQS